MSRCAPTDIDIGRSYTPQPVQRKFHASEARYPLLEGGRGGGKSTALLWEAITQCLLVPGANCLLLRRTLTAMEKGGIESLHYIWNRISADLERLDRADQGAILVPRCARQRGGDESRARRSW